MSMEPVQDLCKASFVAAVKDATNVVSGKWKLPIVCALLRADYRFADLERLLQTATARVLSRELRELELNGVLARRSSTQAGKPVALYTLTESGRTLEAVVIGMAHWGKLHRDLLRGASTVGQQQITKQQEQDSMSNEARAVVDRMFDAFKRKDLEAAVATVSDDTVWTHHGSQKLQSLHFVGKAGVRKFFHTNFTAMQVAYFRVLDTIAAGDKVVALGEESFTMEGQEGEFAQKWVQVYTVRDGLITRMEEYATSVTDAEYARIS